MKEILKIIVAAGQEKKAGGLAILDMRQLTTVTDYFVLFSVSSTTQAQAVADHITERLRAAGWAVLRREGERQSRWLLLDCDSAVVHIFVGEERDFYGLERIWGDAPRLSGQ
ncbi:MAG: ribosome silencing factor [Negativicutes bacterium]|nr:ribosome silencing factor [Negativicutes bacterium]